MRLVATEAVMRRYGEPPLDNASAWRLYEGFVAERRIAWAAEPSALQKHWKAFAVRRTPSPKLWMDAYLAAFAVAGGHGIVTTDRAFAQFKGVDCLVLGTSPI